MHMSLGCQRVRLFSIAHQPQRGSAHHDSDASRTRPPRARARGEVRRRTESGMSRRWQADGRAHRDYV